VYSQVLSITPVDRPNAPMGIKIRKLTLEGGIEVQVYNESLEIEVGKSYHFTWQESSWWRMEEPHPYHMVLFPTGEAQLLKDYKLLDLPRGTVTATIVAEDKTVNGLLTRLSREKLGGTSGE